MGWWCDGIFGFGVGLFFVLGVLVGGIGCYVIEFVGLFLWWFVCVVYFVYLVWFVQLLYCGQFFVVVVGWGDFVGRVGFFGSVGCLVVVDGGGGRMV